MGLQFGRSEDDLVGSLRSSLEGTEDKASVPEPFDGGGGLSPRLLPLQATWPHNAYFPPLAGEDPQWHSPPGSEQCFQHLTLITRERIPGADDSLGCSHRLGQLSCHVPPAASRQFHVPEVGDDS